MACLQLEVPPGLDHLPRLRVKLHQTLLVQGSFVCLAVSPSRGQAGLPGCHRVAKQLPGVTDTVFPSLLHIRYHRRGYTSVRSIYTHLHLFIRQQLHSTASQRQQSCQCTQQPINQQQSRSPVKELLHLKQRNPRPLQRLSNNNQLVGL